MVLNQGFQVFWSDHITHLARAGGTCMTKGFATLWVYRKISLSAHKEIVIIPTLLACDFAIKKTNAGPMVTVKFISSSFKYIWWCVYKYRSNMS